MRENPAKPEQPIHSPTGEAAASTDAIDPALVLPIVVGSTLRAERDDRPTAQTLRDALATAAGSIGLTPTVCTDLLYLNDPVLLSRAALCVGSPSDNALAAQLASRVPSAFVVDDVLMVQFDLEAKHGHACCWGVDADSTQQAVRVFLERYAGAFLAGCREPLQ